MPLPLTLEARIERKLRLMLLVLFSLSRSLSSFVLAQAPGGNSFVFLQNERPR